MEYEPGCENYHFKETRRDKWNEAWDRFHIHYGWAVVPCVLFLCFAVTLLILMQK
jgi:hypothetical protein